MEVEPHYRGLTGKCLKCPEKYSSEKSADSWLCIWIDVKSLIKFMMQMVKTCSTFPSILPLAFKSHCFHDHANITTNAHIFYLW